LKTNPPEAGADEVEEVGVVEGLKVDPAKENAAGAVGGAGASIFFSSTFLGSGAAGGVVKMAGIVGGVGLSPSTSISLSFFGSFALSTLFPATPSNSF
jgi:hypothetical protein